MIPFSLGHIAKREEAAPYEVESLKLYLDAGQEVVLDNDGRVTSWLDVSGNFYSYDQLTPAARPLYQPAGLNGLPALLFDGVDDFLITSNGRDITRNIDCLTIFAVFSHANVAGARCYWANSTAGAGSGSPRVNMYWAASGSGHLPQFNGRRLDTESIITRNPSSPVTPFNTPRVVTSQINYAAASILFWLNATAATSYAGGNITAGRTSDADSGNSRIGSTLTGANFFSGPLAEYQKLLTTTERQLIQNYLLNKYGL
jgi:hypothetical protein